MKLLLPIVLILCGLYLFLPVKVERTSLIIPKGTSVQEMAEILEEKGILRTGLSFVLLHLLLRDYLKYGEYEFEGYVTPFHVYRKIARGEQKIHVISIPEGSDIYDIAKILRKKGIIRREEDFIKVADSPATAHSYGLKVPSMEGFLFPDTYHLTRGIPPEDIVEVMYTNFIKKTKDLRRQLKEKNLSLEEWVTVASLVEKETHIEEERPLVASVIYNRLKKGMKLQIDPTVIYALKRRGLWRGRLSREDLKVKDPYNTYLYKGLPPSPICNPGLSSLRASLFPARTDFLYFVLDPSSGRHRFSTSYREHLNFIKRIKKDLRY